jgi:isopenicillin N synthase-like dioxygenase
VQALPRIDVSALLDGTSDATAVQSIGLQLRSALSEFGAFLCIGHGLQGDEVRRLSRDFFALPSEQKQPHLNDGARLGYVPNFGRTATRESIKCRMPLEVLESTPWPDATFGSAYCQYYVAVEKLCGRLLETLASSLGKSEEAAADLQRDHISSMEVAFYESLQSADGEPSVVCDGHRDGTPFTVLLPDADGLQYRNARTGAWEHALCPEGAVVVQAGDILARWTDGVAKAPEHRVLDLGGKGRLSIMFFHNPRPDCVVSAPGAPVVTAEASRKQTVSQRFHSDFFSQKHYYATPSSSSTTARGGGA